MTMKKRIISMLLIVATLVLTLAGCAYSYEKDDMSNYVTFNKDEFIAGLASLQIADGSFGVDEEGRWKKVDDAVIEALVKLADADVKVTDKVIGTNDLLYYCYYVTGTVAATETTPARDFTIYLDNMDASKPTKLQLGLSTVAGLDKKIADAIKDIDLKDYAYVTKASGTTQYIEAKEATETEAAKVPQTVVVTYTESYKSGDKTVETVYTGAIKVLNEEVAKNGDAAAPATFEQFLVNKTVGSVLSGEFKATENRGEGLEAVEVTYSNIKINWILEGGKELDAVIKHTPYASTLTTAQNKTPVQGAKDEKIDLRGIELTYHVLPVYYTDVIELGELKAETVLKDILGKSMSAGTKNDEGKIEGATLNVFEDLSYTAAIEGSEERKNVNEIATDLIKLLTELSEKKTAMDNKKKDYDAAQKAVDNAGENATQDQKDKAATLKKEYEGEDGNGGLKKEYNDKDAEVDAKITLLLSCQSSTEGAKAITEAIVDDYKQSIYDSKESTYKNDIRKNLASAIYALALSKMTFGDNLPEKAVKDAYDRIYNNYEYDFYRGNYKDGNSSSSSSTSTATQTNYDKYLGNFDNYLRAQLLDGDTTATRKDIENAIMAEAKAAVKDTVFVYALKAACPDSVNVTEEQKEEFKSGWQYIFYLQYYLGEQNIDESYYLPALQLDNIMNYFLEVKDEDPADNKIVYERLQYTFK